MDLESMINASDTAIAAMPILIVAITNLVKRATKLIDTSTLWGRVLQAPEFYPVVAIVVGIGAYMLLGEYDTVRIGVSTGICLGATAVGTHAAVSTSTKRRMKDSAQ